MSGDPEAFRGSAHEAAQRAADIIDALVPRSGRPLVPAGEREQLVAVLRRYGETGPLELTDADLAALRRAARELHRVFAAPDIAAAAQLINALLTGQASPPRLTTHGGGHAWHLHVDSSDDAPWAEWFLTSSALALAVLLAGRQAPPAGLCPARGCGRPFVNTGRGAARRYCSAACGTRERVSAHRGRGASAAP